MEYYAINTSPSLSHFGILGMKWGIRRYQNKDGSLTEEGKRRYSSDSTPGIKEAKNALIKEGNKLKNIYKEYNKIVDIPESETTKYFAISQISDFALTGFEDMSLGDYANQAFLGAFNDGAQGNINPSTLRLYEKNILNNNTLSRISDLYDIEDEHLENARTVVSNVLRKNGIVDENINNYTTNYIMYHRPVEIPKTNTPMFEAAGSRPFSQYEKDTINKVKNFSKGLKNQNDTNTWWYLNEAISNLGLDSIKCTDMTQSTWDKINEEISRLKSINHSDLLYKDYLAHHGILGMKWGIRRYQNKDGSLTPAGMKRYNKLVSEANKLKPPSENQNGNDNNNSNNYTYNKPLNNYSNEYLSRETQRLQLENNYMRQRNDTLRLNSEYNRLKNPPKQKSEGRKFVEAMLKQVATTLITQALKDYTTKKKNNDSNKNSNNNNQNIKNIKNTKNNNNSYNTKSNVTESLKDYSDIDTYIKKLENINKNKNKIPATKPIIKQQPKKKMTYRINTPDSIYQKRKNIIKKMKPGLVGAGLSYDERYFINQTRNVGNGRFKLVVHNDTNIGSLYYGVRFKDNYYSINTYDNGYLAHHGILGMKWGVRRFQNEDGTLTEAGKKRYRSYDQTLETTAGLKNMARYGAPIAAGLGGVSTLFSAVPYVAAGMISTPMLLGAVAGGVLGGALSSQIARGEMFLMEKFYGMRKRHFNNKLEKDRNKTS